GAGRVQAAPGRGLDQRVLDDVGGRADAECLPAQGLEALAQVREMRTDAPHHGVVVPRGRYETSDPGAAPEDLRQELEIVRAPLGAEQVHATRNHVLAEEWREAAAAKHHPGQPQCTAGIMADQWSAEHV